MLGDAWREVTGPDSEEARGDKGTRRKRARSPDEKNVDMDVRRPIRRRRSEQHGYGEQPLCVGIRVGGDAFVRPREVLQKIERAKQLLTSDPCILSTAPASRSAVSGARMPKGKTASASESMITNGRIGNSRVVIKVALDAAEDNALEFERWVYTNVTNSLIVNGYSQHVPFAYGDIVCPSDSKVFGMLKEITGSVTKSERVHYLVTEFGGTPLKEKRKELGEDDVLSIMFQVLWTLRCFQDIGLMHNDLHIGNVLLMRRPVIGGWGDINYRMDDQRGNVWKFTLPAPTHMAKIFDFDRSSKVATAYSSCERTNTAVADGAEFSDMFGQRRGFTKKFDLFTFMYGLWVSGGVVRDTVEGVLGRRNTHAMFSRARTETFGHPGLPCVDRRTRRCTIEIPPDDMLPPLSVLISTVAGEISRRQKEKGLGLLSLFVFGSGASSDQVYLLPSSVARPVTNLTKPLAEFGKFMNRLRETDAQLRRQPPENFIAIDDVMYMRDMPSMENPDISEVEEHLKRAIAKGTETANSLMEKVRAAGLGSRAALQHAEQLATDLLFMQQLTTLHST